MKTLSESIIGRRGNSGFTLNSGDIVITCESKNYRYLYLGPEYIDLFRKYWKERSPDTFAKGLMIQRNGDGDYPDFIFLSYSKYDGKLYTGTAEHPEYNIAEVADHIDLRHLDIVNMSPGEFKKFLRKNNI